MSSTQKNIWLDVPGRDAEVEQVFSHAFPLSREKPCNVGVHVAHQLLVTWQAEREHGEEMTLKQHRNCHHELVAFVVMLGRCRQLGGWYAEPKGSGEHAGRGSVWVCEKVGGRGMSGPRSHLLLPAVVRQKGTQKLHVSLYCHNFKSLFYGWPQPHRRLSQPEQWLKKIARPQLCPAEPCAPRRAALCQPCVQLPGLSGNHVSDYMGNETRALFVCGSD